VDKGAVYDRPEYSDPYNYSLDMFMGIQKYT